MSAVAVISLCDRGNLVVKFVRRCACVVTAEVATCVTRCGAAMTRGWSKINASGIAAQAQIQRIAAPGKELHRYKCNDEQTFRHDRVFRPIPATHSTLSVRALRVNQPFYWSEQCLQRIRSPKPTFWGKCAGASLADCSGRSSLADLALQSVLVVALLLTRRPHGVRACMEELCF